MLGISLRHSPIRIIIMFPGRCLFAGMMEKKSNTEYTSMHGCSHADDGKLEEELRQVCKKTVAQFQHTYQFDLISLSPTTESNELKRTASVGQFGSQAAQTPSTWRWESVDLQTTYVPEFYHPQYARSRKSEQSYLVKTASVPLFLSTQSKQALPVPNNIKSSPKKTNVPKPSKNLFTLWQPRIRRSLRTEHAPGEVKDNKASTGSRDSTDQNPKNDKSTKVQTDPSRRSRSQDTGELPNMKGIIIRRSVTTDRDTRQCGREYKSNIKANSALDRHLVSIFH
ncbi:hypothetical protein FBUS_05050 [Fasciolopsis buskii]|uniref:Uncharacterized protein n=1 Tax=Fasciolopsis buskii TaxID=27845 RepID=A0A8E0S222_9TREM|nr:hypothetical protein FBUS_05050 [Fasciolopsis buski]